MQKDADGADEVVVAYAGRSLHKAEKPYSTLEKECLTVIWALAHFRPYVEGLHVTFFTDHNSLKWLLCHPNPSGRLAIIHKPGAHNNVPDALSRNPLPLSTEAPTDLLADYAIIGRPNIKQLQLDDPVTGQLYRDLEANSQADSDGTDPPQFVVHDSLLYYRDPKSRCGLHQC